MSEDAAPSTPIPRWRLRQTAWEEARNGDPGRMAIIYANTIRRARERGLIPLAIGFGLNDQGRSMVVAHRVTNAAFNVSYLYVPSRDGYYGFYAMPPTVLKDALRSFVTKPPEETTH